MKIKEMYLIFDKNKEIKKNYITTFGQAQCNLYGCICVEQEINLLKDILKSHTQIEKEIDLLLTKWEQVETNMKQTLNNIITTMPYKKSFYSEKYKELSKKETNLYASYYNTIHIILNADEIYKIQKQINYNFMSNDFINKMIEILESKEG